MSAARLASRLRAAALARVQRQLDERWASHADPTGGTDDPISKGRADRAREITPHFIPISSVNDEERGSRP
jgi:hypothetical protein